MKTGDVYLAAGSQSEASSQQQDDVPGHSLVNDLPAQQSGRSLHHLTCETQVRQKTINTFARCVIPAGDQESEPGQLQRLTCLVVAVAATCGQPRGDDEEEHGHEYGDRSI